jgi:hypothetical protein
VQAALAIAAGDDYAGAVMAGIGGAWTAGLHAFFWVTIIFVVIERVDATRKARDEITGAARRWTVDRLPALPPGRVTAGETVGEVLTTLISIGGILFLNGAVWFTDASGAVIPLFNPDLWGLWMPILIGWLVAIAGLQVLIFLRGRWTTSLAVVHAVFQLNFTVPFVGLALTGSLINPAFADALGWPPLAHGNGPVMLSIAGGVVLVTAWEIFDGFRRARRAGGEGATLGTTEGATR